MQIYKDGQVAHYREVFPNTSFPAGGPSDDFLAANNAVKVSMFRPHDKATQKLVPCAPVIENGFAYTVEVVDKTEEEITAAVANKAAQIREARDRALSNSDWTQVADAPVDKNAWALYRQELRDLPNAEGWPDVSLPAAPGASVLYGNGD